MYKTNLRYGLKNTNYIWNPSKILYCTNSHLWHNQPLSYPRKLSGWLLPVLMLLLMVQLVLLLLQNGGDRGSTEASFFNHESPKKRNSKVPCHSQHSQLLLPGVSRYYLPPFTIAMHSPPPLAQVIPCLHTAISRLADTVACRLPKGVPLSWPIFKFCPPISATLCRPT